MAILLYFKDGELEELKKIRYEIKSPQIQKKIEAVILHFHGLSTEKISEIIGVWPAAIRKYLNQYRRLGLEGLLERKTRPRQSELHDFEELLRAEFEARPPAKIAEAKDRIERLTGLVRGKTQVRVFLHSLGMKFRKTGVIPAKVDLDKQDQFKKK